MAGYSVEQLRDMASTLRAGTALLSQVDDAADMLTAYAERIKADEGAADYPECSGDPSSCPENEGRGCYCSDLHRKGEPA